MKHLTQEEWAVMMAQEAEPGFVGWLPPTEARGFRLQMQIPPTRIGGPGWYERDAEPLYAASALAARDQRIAELEQRIAAQDALLRRVRDAATAEERKRCAAVCRDIAEGWMTLYAVAPHAAEMCADAIERQEGE